MFEGFEEFTVRVADGLVAGRIGGRALAEERPDELIDEIHRFLFDAPTQPDGR